MESLTERRWESSRLMSVIKHVKTICTCGNDKKPGDGSCGCIISAEYTAAVVAFQRALGEVYQMAATLDEVARATRAREPVNLVALAMARVMAPVVFDQ